jgi:hypothetical protein
MVGAMLRHLRSLRLMKRDGGWIKKLLEEYVKPFACFLFGRRVLTPKHWKQS